MLEWSKNHIQNGFEKVSWCSFKSGVLLSDLIDHLISIKWFLKSTSQKDDDFNGNWAEKWCF